MEAPLAAVREDDYRKRAPIPQPVVFVLPGIMGSTLSVNKDRVWIDRINLARGAMSDLRVDADVKAEELVAASYRELVRHLSASHEVVPFPYDWRRPLEKSAEALREKLESKLDAMEGTDQPVRLLAHSMGGLVVRTMLATEDGQKTWNRMCAHPGARFIMLGTPNGGSHSIGAMLIGRDRLVRQLALLDLHHPYKELLAILSDFDGALALLPHTRKDQLDLYDPEVWKQLHEHDARIDRGIFGSKPADPSKSADVAWTIPNAKRLSGARAAGKAVQTSPIDPSRMIYVAGIADQTPCDILLDTSAPAGRRVTVLATSRGDGRVPWDTGIPSELAGRTYYMEAVHGDLANTEESFPALVDLLNTGTTSKLSPTPPATRGGKAEKFPLKVEEADAFPDDASLVSAALGGRRGRKPRRTSERVRVRVVHDDLLWAKSPVLVGHYIDDVFVGAEASLDRQLDGRLRELQRQDLYPGACNTVAVVLNTPVGKLGTRLHPGAIVAGLGTVGELSPGALSATICHALTSYGAESVAMERRRRQLGQSQSEDAELRLGVTALLVGTGAGGVRLADSIQSILRGVYNANARLAAAREQVKGESGKPSLIAQINSVDICELFEDLAIRAVVELNALALVSEFKSDFVFDNVLVPGKSGEQRATFDDFPGWWQRVRISHQENDELKFESLTERARVEASLLSTQRVMVKGLLDQAIRSTATDLNLCGTLFELLVPQRLKEHAPDRRPLVLLLDEQSAQLPWELMYDRWDSGSKPVSVETGMVRQRITADFRPQPARTAKDTALVIGDPPLEGSTVFSQLPGAAAEATTVANTLREKGFETTAFIGPEARWPDIVSALYGKAYRVLHLAAHGVFEYEHEPKRKKVSGVVLGNGAFLTPSEFEQMRVVPDLVFINCCHLGRDGEYGRDIPVAFPQLAANVGQQLIQMGVRVVIAAGWAVDDQAADAFARTFYDEMLRGQEFGVAVRHARREIFDRFGAANTWGAYQCYGDPGYVLTPGSNPSGADGFVAERQFYYELMRLANKVRGNPDRKRDVLQRLERMVGAAPPAWRNSGVTAAAIAEAYAELGRFEDATKCYDRVLIAEPATASLRSVEQLANLLSRLAAEQEEPNLEAMERSARLLRSLVELGENAERRSLLGGTYKRLAENSKDERLPALQSAIEAYARGYELKKSQKADDPWYPLLNLLACQVALSWQPQAAATPLQITAEMDELRQHAKTVGATSFWELALPADVHLLEAAVAGELSEDEQRTLQSAYRSAVDRASTPKETASVVSQVRFLREMARSSKRKKIGTFGHALEEMLKSLTS